MAIKPVLKLGNPQLISSSHRVVDFSSQALGQLVEDMRDTMKALGGVGLAAPQIGVSLRVIVFGFESSSRYPNEKPVPWTILINPTIDILSEDETEDWEGCLSLPGLRGLVPRFHHIRYHGYDENGQGIKREAQGFHARIVQHELDHLNGILYPERIRDMKKFGFEGELTQG